MNQLRQTFGSRSESPAKEDDNQARLLSNQDYGDEKASSTDSERFHDGPAWTQRPLFRWSVSLFLLGIYTVIISLYLTSKQSDNACGKQISMWSPLNDAINYEEIKISNTFAQQSKYRGPPTPDLEKAWEDLWYFDVAPFPGDKLTLVNQSAVLPDGRLLQPVADDVGSYAVEFGVFHQLHCLNRIRQYTWRDWYFRHPDIVRTPSSMLDSDVGARMHTDHCLEALRISLMCHGDTTALFAVQDPSAPLGIRADFSPQRKCRNFASLHSWMKDHSANADLGHDFEPDEAATGNKARV